MPGLTRPPIHRALSIAVQYKHRPDSGRCRLPGTHRDPQLLTKILKLLHFHEDNITILMDDEAGKYRQPTHANILEEMDKLLADARPGDHFVFHFSGHGDQIPNLNGTEEDGFDEIIWPVDVKLNVDGTVRDNYIIDDIIHEKLVKRVPAGAHFMMIFDCCHSGTAADLPNSSRHTPPKSLRVHATADEHGHSHDKPHFKKKVAMPDVTSWSACADDETTPGSERGGVFLRAFYECLKNNKGATRGALLHEITEHIQRKIHKHNALRRSRGSDDMYEPRDAREGSANNHGRFPLTHPELGAEGDLAAAYAEPVIDRD